MVVWWRWRGFFVKRERMRKKKEGVSFFFLIFSSKKNTLSTLLTPEKKNNNLYSPISSPNDCATSSTSITAAQLAKNAHASSLSPAMK